MREACGHRKELQLGSKGSLLENSFLHGGGRFFVPLRPAPDWISPSHIIEGNLLYSKSASFNVHLIQKYPHRSIQNNV